MEASDDPDQCTKCSKQYPKTDEKVCSLCKTTPYCSEWYEGADFENHRGFCTVKEKTLLAQHECAVCEEQVDGDGEICATCSGIKYCSTKCKERNAKQHTKICDAYASLAARPTKYHRLHILFPWDQDKPRFIWVPDSATEDARLKSIDRVVAPETEETEGISVFEGFSEDCTKAYRSVGGVHARACNVAPLLDDQRNRSLGLMLTGRPARSMHGNLVLFATNYSECQEYEEPEEEPGDCLPADIPKLVHIMAMHEMMSGGGFRR